MKKLLPILVTTTLLISACSDSGESSETTSSTTSSSPSSTTTSSTTSSTSSVTTSSSSEVTPPPEVEEPDEEDEHDDDDLHVHDNPNAALGDSDEEERAKQAPAEKTVSSVETLRFMNAAQRFSRTAPPAGLNSAQMKWLHKLHSNS